MVREVIPVKSEEEQVDAVDTGVTVINQEDELPDVMLPSLSDAPCNDTRNSASLVSRFFSRLQWVRQLGSN